MKKRIFIAINLPIEIKKSLTTHRKRWKNLKVRWSTFENMHITLEFMGNVDQTGLDAILLAVERTVSGIDPFNIRLDRIVLGPNLIQPKMFWITICMDDYLIKLKDLLDQNLISAGFSLEDREFKPHITLARAKGNQLKGKQTNVSLSELKFRVENIEVMQSQLNPKGSRYKVVGSFRFMNHGL